MTYEVGTRTAGEYCKFASLQFSKSYEFSRVSIKQLDYELEISIAL